MQRTIQILCAVLLILAIMWWIYSKRFGRQEKIIKLVLQGKIIEKLLEEEIMDNTSTDIKETDTHLSVVRTPEFIRKIFEKTLGGAYQENQKCLKELKKFLKGDELSKDVEFEDDFLNSYITSHNCETFEAFSKIRNILNLRSKHGYLFQRVNVDFTPNPAYRFLTLLPFRRKDGSATVLFKLAKWDPEEVPFEHLKQLFFMIFMQEIRNPVTQASGFNVIYDFADADLRYLKFGTPQNIYLFSHVSFDVIPVKYNGFHLINITFVGNFLLTLIRPFLPQSIKEILYTHSSVEDLHEFFPLSMLPAEYGGNLTSYYMAEWLKKANEQHHNFPAGGQKNVLS